jgi:hypothetical protein
MSVALTLCSEGDRSWGSGPGLRSALFSRIGVAAEVLLDASVTLGVGADVADDDWSRFIISLFVRRRGGASVIDDVTVGVVRNGRAVRASVSSFALPRERRRLTKKNRKMAETAMTAMGTAIATALTELL